MKISIYINKQNMNEKASSDEYDLAITLNRGIKKDVSEREIARITNRRMITTSFMLNESCNVDPYYSFTKKTHGHPSLINMRKRIAKFY